MPDREQHDAPLDWGASDEMNALEALMWRVEVDPQLRSTIFLINVLDRVPEWDRLVAAHEWGTRMVPRFRKRVAEAPLGVGGPYWTTDEQFDLHYHVRRIGLPAPGTWTQVLTTAEQIAMTPFDRSRAPWEAYLIEGLKDGRCAYMLKLHHSVTDGMASTQLFNGLYSRSREPNAAKPQPPMPPVDTIGSAQALVRQAGRDVRGATGLIRSIGAGLLRSASRPADSVRDALGYADSLRRVITPPTSHPSPLLRERSMSSRLVALDVSFADFRTAAKSVGTSINDAFVASQLGGFRLYHEALGCPIETMPVSMPISVRRENDPEGGNRFAGASFDAPVGIADPARRLQTFHAMVRKARAEVAVDALGFVSPALARLPTSVLARVTGALTRGNDLQTSSIPGIMGEDVFLAGGRIDRAFGFGPLPGCAVMSGMVSHADRCCVGINIDPAAVTEVELFGECIEQGFAEVLALHPGAEPPVRLR